MASNDITTATATPQVFVFPGTVEPSRELVVPPAPASTELVKVVVDKTIAARATKRGQKVADNDTANFQRQLEETNRMLESYLDIQDNPRYYDQPKELLLDGRKAIDGLAEGVLNAVKRGNTDALLQFQTSTMVLQAERYK